MWSFIIFLAILLPTTKLIKTYITVIDLRIKKIQTLQKMQLLKEVVIEKIKSEGVVRYFPLQELDLKNTNAYEDIIMKNKINSSNYKSTQMQLKNSPPDRTIYVFTYERNKKTLIKIKIKAAEIRVFFQKPPGEPATLTQVKRFISSLEKP